MSEIVETSSAPAGAELQHYGGGRFCLVGSVDYDNAGQVLADGQKLFSEHDEVVVDLGSADVANTAGLAVMMEWASWSDIKDIVLTFDGLKPCDLAVAEMNGVALMIPVCRG